jgi:hypothetical protein
VAGCYLASATVHWHARLPVGPGGRRGDGGLGGGGHGGPATSLKRRPRRPGPTGGSSGYSLPVEVTQWQPRPGRATEASGARRGGGVGRRRRRHHPAHGAAAVCRGPPLASSPGGRRPLAARPNLRGPGRRAAALASLATWALWPRWQNATVESEARPPAGAGMWVARQVPPVRAVAPGHPRDRVRMPCSSSG